MLLAVVMGITILVTLKFQAWLGLLAATLVLMFFLFQEQQPHLRWVSLGAGIVGVVAIGAIIGWHGIHQPGTGRQPSVPYVDLWSSAL